MNSNIAKTIDHTILSPTCTEADIKNLCTEAIDMQFAAVCVPPIYVQLAKKTLGDSSIKVATVVGFPFGYDTLSTKIEAVKKAIDDRADELDVVVNLSALKSKKFSSLENEVETISTLIKSKHRKIFKLILETAHLDEEELAYLCNVCNSKNVDYAKTSTGFAPTGADLETVKKMRSLLNDNVKIKASGGIRDAASAAAFIAAGADRIGTSSGIKIMQES